MSSHSLRPLLILATLGTTGALAGSGVATLLAAQIFEFDPSADRSIARAQPRSRDEAPVVRESFFSPPPAPAPRPHDGPPPACLPGWSLFGALVDRDAPERSVAAVRTPEGTLVLRPNRPLDGATLVSLGPHEAEVRDADGRVCSVRMGALAETVVSADPSPQPSAPTGDEVMRIGERHYRLSRSLLDAPAPLHGQPRVVPHATDGRTDGARIYGVRPGSLVARAGLENGDLLRAVDGVSLTTPEVALEAYAHLRSGQPIRLTVERGGAPIELTYEVESAAGAPAN